MKGRIVIESEVWIEFLSLSTSSLKALTVTVDALCRVRDERVRLKKKIIIIITGCKVLRTFWKVDNYVPNLHCHLKISIILEPPLQNNSIWRVMINVLQQEKWAKGGLNSIYVCVNIKSLHQITITFSLIPFDNTPGHAFVLSWQSTAPMYQSNWARLWESAMSLTGKPGSGEQLGAFNFRAIMFTPGIWSSVVRKGGGRGDEEKKKTRGRKEKRRPVGGMPKSSLEERPDKFQRSLHCLPAFDIWSLLGTGAEVRPEKPGTYEKFPVLFGAMKAFIFLCRVSWSHIKRSIVSLITGVPQRFGSL